MSLGPTEIIVILAIALLFFGPKRLPGLGKSLGESIRSFKKGINEDETREVTEVLPEQSETRKQNASMTEEQIQKAKERGEKPS